MFLQNLLNLPCECAFDVSVMAVSMPCVRNLSRTTKLFPDYFHNFAAVESPVMENLDILLWRN